MVRHVGRRSRKSFGGWCPGCVEPWALGCVPVRSEVQRVELRGSTRLLLLEGASSHTRAPNRAKFSKFAKLVVRSTRSPRPARTLLPHSCSQVVPPFLLSFYLHAHMVFVACVVHGNARDEEKSGWHMDPKRMTGKTGDISVMSTLVKNPILYKMANIGTGQ